MDANQTSPQPVSDAADATEFYIGWMPQAPAGLARFARRFVWLLVPLVIAVAALAAASQERFEAGLYEFGVERDFEGVLYEKPVPVLRVAQKTADSSAPAAANFPLVGFGKSGLPEEARGYDGKKVAFKGSLAFRRGTALIEINDPASFKVLGDPEPWEARGPAETLGRMTLRGEIVDTKCFLGVMRPATGKVHRACAIRCLEGGVPAGLWVRGEGGVDEVFLLAAPEEGKPLDLDIQLAGLPVEARGVVETQDDLAILRLESVRRLTVAEN